MSMLESSEDKRGSSQPTDRPGSRDTQERGMRASGFAPHDEFRAPSRKPGLAIFDYEEGESI